MAPEPISPELALVDPDLAARARLTLPDPQPPLRMRRAAAAAAPAHARERHYPFWARVTAALWLLVLGILIGGAAIPHAQDKPRVVPVEEDVPICRPGQEPQEGPPIGTLPGS